jgi:anti-anti-sigma factor
VRGDCLNRATEPVTAAWRAGAGARRQAVGGNAPHSQRSGRREQSGSVAHEIGSRRWASSSGQGHGWNWRCSGEEPGFRAEANRDGNNSAAVRLSGELDIASAGAARRALELLDAGIQQIVLDLSDITFCDAAGVRFLLAAQKQARTIGRDLVVRHPSRPVRRVLTITGELSAICPADSPAAKNHNRQTCATPSRRTHHPPEAHSRMICAPVHWGRPSLIMHAESAICTARMGDRTGPRVSRTSRASLVRAREHADRRISMQAGSALTAQRRILRRTPARAPGR